MYIHVAGVCRLFCIMKHPLRGRFKFGDLFGVRFGEIEIYSPRTPSWCCCAIH